MSQSRRPKTLKDSLLAARELEHQRRQTVESQGFDGWFGWLGRLAVLFAALVPPWLIGGVGNQAMFLVSVALLVGLAAWWIEMALAQRTSHTIPYVMLLVVIGIGIGLIQTVPLPESLSRFLIGEQAEWYATVGNAVAIEGWQPTARISLDVEETWHHIRLLVMGLAGLLLGCHFFRRSVDLVCLLGAVTINGTALALFGIFQKITDNGKLYWVIELLSGGQPFGPFVNRNNAAGYLLLCLAAAIGLMTYLWQKRESRGPSLIVSREIPIWRQIQEHLQLLFAEITATKLAVMGALMLIGTGIIVSLSRGGVTALLAATIVSILLFGMARKPKMGGLIFLPLILGVVALTSWVGFNDQLLKRFDELSVSENLSSTDARIRTWAETAKSVGKMGWLGSGLGAYSHVQQLFSTQPDRGVYVYAENQFVQSLIDAGIPGLISLLLAIGIFVYGTLFLLFRGNSPASVAVGTAGVFLVTSQTLASFFDFGWYIPANTVLLSILTGVVSYHFHAFAARLKKKSILRGSLPNLLTQGVAIAVFCGLVITSISLYQIWDSEKRLVRGLRLATFETLDLATTETKILEIKESLGKTPSTRQLNQLGDLWLHRSRLLVYKNLVEVNQEPAWSSTELIRLLEHLSFLRVERGMGLINEFKRQPFINDCLPPAAYYFQASLRVCPMQPEVVDKLAMIHGLFEETEKASRFAELGVRMAPSNIHYNVQASLINLFIGNRLASIPYLRKVLELEPLQFVKVISFIQGLTGRLREPLSSELIAQQIIPDNPNLIYEFVTRYLPAESPMREELLERALNLMEGVPQTDQEIVLLKANLLLEKKDLTEAADQLKIAVDNRPSDPHTRYRYARLLIELERYDEALKQARRLLSDDESPKHKTLINEIQTLISRQNSNSPRL